MDQPGTSAGPRRPLAPVPCWAAQCRGVQPEGKAALTPTSWEDRRARRGPREPPPGRQMQGGLAVGSSGVDVDKGRGDEEGDEGGVGAGHGQVEGSLTRLTEYNVATKRILCLRKLCLT